MRYCSKRKKIAKRYSVKNLITQKWKVFLIYIGQKIVRLRVGAIHPKNEVKWVIFALVKDIKDTYKIVSSSVTQVLKWWGYGLELYLQSRKGLERDTPDLCVRRTNNKRSCRGTALFVF